MSTIVLRSWRRIRDLPVLRYAMLVFIPLFARPLHFSKSPDRPVYTRLKGLITLPMFVGALWRSSTISMYQWMGKRESEHLGSGITQSDIWNHMHSTQGWVGQGALAVAILSIYAVAVLRWGYHIGAASVCRKLGFSCAPITLLYFVVTSAAWGLWVGLIVKGIDYSIWYSNGDLSSYFNLSTSQHPYRALGLFLFIGAATYRASINSSHGMAAVYGGSKFLAFMVGILPVSLVLGLIYVYEAFVLS
ncbi:hypothetical protein MRS45_12035 [Pseudomonas viridiflava]|uniref:hypothetical protein n=1 Tax=Pseudomonas viridiflava TaxID=33069 RepID=UPI001FD6F7EB|nr:hypothetical protein [Pseudomonas viridiflava]MCJ8176827.1 hypothetical protein [Pseudomonas viridiflava]